MSTTIPKHYYLDTEIFEDDAASLRDALGSIEEEILAAKPAIAAMEMAAEHVMQHACNWKVSAENFSECYHCVESSEKVIHKMRETAAHLG